MNRLFIVLMTIGVFTGCLQTASSYNLKNSFLQLFQGSDDDANSLDRPGADQKSLLIVFDTTGSMNTDLVEMRTGAQDIVNNFAGRKDKPIYNYVLSLFNDPKVEDPIVTRNFQEIVDKLKTITVSGGGDCPEMALTGLRNAIEVGLQKSPAFLFSDASAKDYDLYDQVGALIQRKQTSVNFFLTGDCNGLGTPEYKVYNKIARTSGGQLFRLDRSSVRDVLVATSVSLDTDFVSLQSIESEAAGSTILPVVIDESVKRISVTLSGTNAKLTIKDGSGNPLAAAKESTDIFSSANIQIITFTSTSSKYTIEASAESDYYLRVGGLSDLKFDFGFSQKSPSSITDTYFRPLFGKKTILSVFVNDLSLIKNLELVKIVPASSESDFPEFTVALKREKVFFVTEPFSLPNSMFRVQIRGLDPNDIVIDRLISTGIESTSGIEPIVEIDYERLSAPDAGKLTLDCKVKSLTSVKIQWKFEEELLQEETFDESVNYYLEVKNFSEGKIGYYTCSAENSLGKDSMKVFVEMCSIDDDPTCTSFAVTGKNVSKTLLMSSIVIFLVKLLNF